MRKGGPYDGNKSKGRLTSAACNFLASAGVTILRSVSMVGFLTVSGLRLVERTSIIDKGRMRFLLGWAGWDVMDVCSYGRGTGGGMGLRKRRRGRGERGERHLCFSDR